MNERTWSLSGNPPTIEGNTVTKVVDEHEATMLSIFTDVCPKVLELTAMPQLNSYLVKMERLTPICGAEYDIAKLAGQRMRYVSTVPFLLRDGLWKRPVVEAAHPQWQEKLTLVVTKMTKSLHISGMFSIAENAASRSKNMCAIHGDPTLANTVWDSNNMPRLVDPTYRPYIPCDPHVDLGKMFQSLLGWEFMLWCHGEGMFIIGDSIPFNKMRSIARLLGLDYKLAMSWAVIHLLRAGVRAKDENMQIRIIQMLQVAYDEAVW